jgi:UDP-glucose 4-epimerase
MAARSGTIERVGNMTAERIVLVTGGAGFIGSHSVEALLAAGWTVRVLDNFSTGKRSNLPADRRLSVIEGDIRDRSMVERAAAGASHALHLAAQVSVQASVADPLTSADINVVGFLNVFDAARRAGVKRVVYASSAAVYGIPASLPLDEQAPTRPISPYGLEKSINDQYAALYADLYAGSALGVRYFNVYGPRQDPRSPYAGVISKFVDMARAGRPLTVFGDGLQTRDFVFVKDVAAVNVAALDAPATGVTNVGTGRTVTLLDMIAALERVIGKPLERQFAAPQPGDIRHSAMRPARLHEVLGFVPATSLDAGLAALVDTA